MSYDFQGTSFDTEARWLRAIAQGWLCAGDDSDTAPDLDDLAGAFADLAVNREW